VDLVSNFGQQHCEVTQAINQQISARITTCNGVKGEAKHVQVLPDKQVVIISGKVTADAEPCTPPPQ
jgi:hypothetical protein